MLSRITFLLVTLLYTSISISIYSRLELEKKVFSCVFLKDLVFVKGKFRESWNIQTFFVLSWKVPAVKFHLIFFIFPIKLSSCLVLRKSLCLMTESVLLEWNLNFYLTFLRCHFTLKKFEGFNSFSFLPWLYCQLKDFFSSRYGDNFGPILLQTSESKVDIRPDGGQKPRDKIWWMAILVVNNTLLFISGNWGCVSKNILISGSSKVTQHWINFSSGELEYRMWVMTLCLWFSKP